MGKLKEKIEDKYIKIFEEAELERDNQAKNFVMVNLKNYTDIDIISKISHNKRVQNERSYFLNKDNRILDNYYKEYFDIKDMIADRKGREEQHNTLMKDIKKARRRWETITSNIAKKYTKNENELSEKRLIKLQKTRKELKEIHSDYLKISEKLVINEDIPHNLKEEIYSLDADLFKAEEKEKSCFYLELDTAKKNKDWQSISEKDMKEVLEIEEYINKLNNKKVVQRLKINEKSETFSSFILGFSHDKFIENMESNPNFREELLEQIETFSLTLQDKYDIQLQSFSLHGDEGSVDEKTNKIKYNLHAHLDFSRENYNLKLNTFDPEELSKLQDLAGEQFSKFGFKRGNGIGQKRLTEEEMRDSKIREAELNRRKNIKNLVESEYILKQNEIKLKRKFNDDFKEIREKKNKIIQNIEQKHQKNIKAIESKGNEKSDLYLKLLSLGYKEELIKDLSFEALFNFAMSMLNVDNIREKIGINANEVLSEMNSKNIKKKQEELKQKSNIKRKAELSDDVFYQPTSAIYSDNITKPNKNIDNK